MRCSLLTLSTYLDNELAPDRAGEVEAHLVACQRCSSGLGYLREEKAHIEALAVVHADEGAAEDLLGTVGLALLPAPIAPPEPAPQFLLDLAESPKASPVPPPPDESGQYLELNGSPSPLAAPETPEPVETTAAPPVDAHAAVADGTVAADAADAEVPPPAMPAPPAPPQWSQSYERAPSLPAAHHAVPPVLPPVRDMPVRDMPVRDMPARDVPERDVPEPGTVVPSFLVDDAADATEQAVVPPHAAPLKPSAPSVAPAPSQLSVALTGRASAWLGRARDAVSVRWALMRGSPADDTDEDDDSIQIVSGTGAPERRGSRSGRGERDVHLPPAAASPQPPHAFAPVDDDTPDISFAPPQHEPLQRPAFTAKERLAAQAALRKLEDEGVITRDDEPSQGGMLPRPPAEPVEEALPRSFHFDLQEPVASPSEVPRPLPREEEPMQPGRHQRALHREGSRFQLPSFTMPRPARPATSRSAGVASPLGDRRLWIFGAVVLVAAMIGLLVGKTVTPVANHLAPGAAPKPTAIALPSAHAQTTPTPAATPQPTPQPTATPVPTPAAPNPNQLTGAQNLGAGGTGFAVQDIRYGAHPGDYRIVFDLSGTGSPATTVGFGASNTLFVIFSGTTGTATVAQPAAGNTATAVKLLQPSPIAGKTIYEFTLSGPATLSTMYLQSPLRLVIDLS